MGEGRRVSITVEGQLPIQVDHVKDVKQGQEILVYVRPEEFVINQSGQGITGTVKVKQFLGKYVNYIIDAGTDTLIEVSSDTNSAERIYGPGEEINLTVNEKRINLFDKDTGTTRMEGVESNVL